MALWQYTFIIAPAEKLSDFRLSNISEVEYDAINFWSDGYDKKFFDPLTGILPESKSWSEDIALLGKEDSNCIEIIIKNKNTIDEVILRIDFRSNYTLIVDEVLSFCALNNLVLLDEELNVEPPNSFKVVSIIENSPQHRTFRELSS